jgi:hypothetical protein
VGVVGPQVFLTGAALDALVGAVGAVHLPSATSPAEMTRTSAATTIVRTGCRVTRCPTTRSAKTLNISSLLCLV